MRFISIKVLRKAPDFREDEKGIWAFGTYWKALEEVYIGDYYIGTDYRPVSKPDWEMLTQFIIDDEYEWVDPFDRWRGFGIPEPYATRLREAGKTLSWEEWEDYVRLWE